MLVSGVFFYFEFHMFLLVRGDPMRMFAQFFGGEDPFSTFFSGNNHGGGTHTFFSTGGDDLHGFSG